jgi:hypothetical protein
MTGSGTDHLTDVGIDTQYQFLGARDSFSVQARFITENQNCQPGAWVIQQLA